MGTRRQATVAVMAARTLPALASLALGMALLDPIAAPGQMAGFEVSVGYRLANGTTLVARRHVSLVASVFFIHADQGCLPADLTDLSASVRLPPQVALPNGAPASQPLVLPPRTGPGSNPAVINASWPVLIAAPGTYSGHLEVSGHGAGGRTCSAAQDFQIFAVAGNLRLRVGGGVLYPDHILIAVQARFPGSARLPATAYEDAVSQSHDVRGENFGKTELNLLSLSAPRRRRGLTIVSASSFSGGKAGVSCIDFQRPRGFPGGTLTYHLHFTWNRDKGFSAVTRQGSVHITTTATNPVERRCLGQERLASGQKPVG